MDQNDVNTNRRGKTGQDESFQGYLSGGFSEIIRPGCLCVPARSLNRCKGVGRIVFLGSGMYSRDL